MRKLFLVMILATVAAEAPAVTLDRVAATIDGQVLTVSEIEQMVVLRFFPRSGRDEDEYRRDVLDALVAQALRFRDVERFGAEDIPRDSVEARLLEIQGRFASPAEFEAALASTELTLEEVQALIKRQLQVEGYIQERFAPLVYVDTEEIETYYRGPWTAQRRERGLAVPPLNAAVSEEIRGLLRSERLATEIERWTDELRERANVDVYAWR